MARINHGTYSGVAMSKVRDRHIADRIAITMIDVPVPTMAPTDSAIPATASREQTTILAIPMRRFCSTVGTGRSASNGATRVACSAGREGRQHSNDDADEELDDNVTPRPGQPEG